MSSFWQKTKKIFYKSKNVISVFVIIIVLVFVGTFVWQNKVINGSQNKKIAQQNMEKVPELVINKEYRQALTILDQSLMLDPQNRQIYQQILDIYLKKRQYQLATEILKVAYQNTNNDEFFDFYQVIVWEQAGELVKALQLADRLWNKTGDSKYLIIKADLYLRQKEQSEARKTLALLGKNQYTQRAYLIKILLTSNVTSDFQQEISIIKWDQVKQDLSNNQTIILLTMAENLSKIIKNNDDKNVYYKTYLANEAGRTGFVGWGQILIEEVLVAENEYSDGWLVKGELQLLSQEYEKAMQSFGQAIRLSPQDYHGYWWRAVVSQKNNDLVQAEKDVIQFLALGGKNDPVMILRDLKLLQDQGQNVNKLLQNILKRKKLSMKITVQTYEELLKIAWQKENKNEVYTVLNKAKLDKRLKVVWANQDEVVKPLYCEQLHYWVNESAINKLEESIKKEIKSTECGLYYQGVLGKKLQTDNWQKTLLQVIDLDITGEWGTLASQALVE